MAEKFKGLMPPNSIWFRLSREESIALLKFQGKFDDFSPEEKSALDSSDIQALPGRVSELEELLVNAGINIITLFD